MDVMMKTKTEEIDSGKMQCEVFRQEIIDL